jgi:hypothetical protein
MSKITRADLDRIFKEYLVDEDGNETEEENPDYVDADLIGEVDDNALSGLNIIYTALNRAGENPIARSKGRPDKTIDVLQGADHDIIYSIDVDVAMEILTLEEFKNLKRLNWMIDEDSECLACFV